MTCFSACSTGAAVSTSADLFILNGVHPVGSRERDFQTPYRDQGQSHFSIVRDRGPLISQPEVTSTFGKASLPIGCHPFWMTPFFVSEFAISVKQNPLSSQK